MKDCPNEDFVSCVYLGEKDITDTSIFYIDYKRWQRRMIAVSFYLC